MSDTTQTPPLTHKLPFVGDLFRDFHGNIYYFLLIVLTALVLAVNTWGLVALAMTGVIMTPIMFTVLMLITVGK